MVKVCRRNFKLYNFELGKRNVHLAKCHSPSKRISIKHTKVYKGGTLRSNLSTPNPQH